MEKINTIIDLLKNNSLVNIDLKAENLNSGTTNGILYLLLVDKKPTYVVKMWIQQILYSRRNNFLLLIVIQAYFLIFFTQIQKNNLLCMTTLLEKHILIEALK